MASKSKQPTISEPRYLLVGLTDEGEELRRIVVFASRLDEAKSVFKGFCDWIDVFECTADAKPSKRRKDLGWSRPDTEPTDGK